MKKALKVLSIALTVVLLIGVFSCATPVFAAKVAEKDNIESTVEQYKTQVENSESESMYEIEEERDKFTKVFQNSSGTKTAIVSSTPIHYETADGWEDIDNTLVEESEGTGKIYKNKKNDFTVTIPKEITSGKELKIEKNDFEISFELEGSDIFYNNKKVGGNKKNKNIKSKNKQNEFNTDFLDKTSGVSFDNVGENTSVEYEVTSTGLKENIILNKKPEEQVTYTYKITAKKLNAQLNSDNSVTFKNADGQAIFEIPAPVMYDAENNISKEIDVEFSGKDGKYTLIYKPSLEWLTSDITYPVVVDPVINTSNAALGIKDTIADSAHPNTNYKDLSTLGTYKSGSGQINSYLDLSDKYTVKNGVKIKSVLLGLYYEYGLFVDNSTTVAAYTITSDWNEATLTYNNKPSTTTGLIDRREINRDNSNGYFLFDVTKAYISPEDTYGVCIRQRDTVTSEALLTFSSSETTSSSQQPYFVIEYYESQGVEEQFDYHAFDVGRAGMVYFNDFTEQIYIERDELGLSGIKMPVQIKRYFNSGLGGTYSGYYRSLHHGLSYYGVGWRTNYNQTIEYYKDINGKANILYCNGEGKTTYFAKTDEVDENGNIIWEEEADAFSNTDGYTLYLPSQYSGNVSGNLQYATIKDSAGQIYEFNSFGLLTKINSAEEASTSSITITYPANDFKIQKITDGAGREYRFSYTEYEEWLYPLLTSIQAFSPSGTAITVTNRNGTKVPYKMTYTYSFSNYLGEEDMPTLSTATYPDGETVYYTLSESLATLKNIDGYAIEIRKYNNGSGITELVYPENASEPVIAGELKFLSTNNQYEKALWDPNNVTQIKQFDLFGRVINVVNNDGANVPRTYSDSSKARGEICYGLYVDYEQETLTDETNLITNGDFTNNLSGWSVSSNSNVTRTDEYDCNEDNEIWGALQITGLQNNVHYAQQTVSVDNGASGDEYCIEYFVKNASSHMVLDMLYFNTVIIEARNNIEGNETWETICYVDANPYNGNWQNYSYSFDIDFQYNEIRVILAYYFQYGTVRYDDISLVNTYKATVNQNTDTGTGNENTDSDAGNSNAIGCDCDGCNTPNCPCTACSDACTLPYCNRGYSFENNSDGITFSMTDGEKRMGMEQTVSGNYYDSQKDINGIYTGYSYNQLNGELNSISDANGDVTSFSYDAMSRLRKVSNSVEGLTSGNKMETSYAYENDRIKSITHNGFSYNYEYDIWGNPTAVKVGEQPLVSYTYDSNDKTRDRVNRITYGNGDYTDYTYNSDGNISTIKSYSADGNITADYVYNYSEHSQVNSIKNVIENTLVRYTDDGFEYVALKPDGTDDFTIYSENIDEDGERVEILGGIEYTEADGIIQNDAVNGTTEKSTIIESPSDEYKSIVTTDYFGRTKEKKATYFRGGDEGIKASVRSYEDFTYVNDAENSEITTALVKSHSITTGVYVEEVDETIYEDIPLGFFDIYAQIEYLYDYDAKGNITRVRLKTIDENESEAITELYSYTYDSVGQLVRENNAELDKSIVYVYDKGGNIAQKIEYAYTTEDLGEPVSTINYIYDSVWKDKLTAYGDIQIQTDSMGNPLNYVGTGINGIDTSGSLEWNGRQLAAVTIGNERYEYSYNAEGMRSSVKVYSVSGELDKIYYYIWKNGKLNGFYIKDMNGTDDGSVKMLFDVDGEPIGYEVVESDIEREPQTFFFRRNLQGDIVAVCHKGGWDIITYAYDAWGGVQVLTMDNNFALCLFALICTPITYRGYNYDVFTGLYYLQSRYYNPTYGRFLNVDDTEILEATQGAPIGANLFAYCNNNPVNMVDFTGRSAIVTIVLTIVSVIVFLILAYFKWKTSPFYTFYELYNKTYNCFEPFYVHAQNIVEYGTKINLNPVYPDYYKLGIDKTYVEVCQEAYKTAVDFGYIKINQFWEKMTEEQKFTFTAAMLVYDRNTYYKILLVYMVELIGWGVGQVIGFMSPAK